MDFVFGRQMDSLRERGIRAKVETFRLEQENEALERLRIGNIRRAAVLVTGYL